MHAGSGLYHGGQPLVMNFTVLSGLASSGWFVASPTWELLTDTEAVAEEVNDSVGEVLEEAHSRFELPLLCVVAALIGYAALMASRFSRFGVTRQIVGAIFLLVLIKIIESVVGGPVRANGALWPLIYLPSVSGLGIACLLLWQASRPFRPARRANADPVAEAGA